VFPGGAATYFGGGGGSGGANSGVCKSDYFAPNQKPRSVKLILQLTFDVNQKSETYRYR
jgi:hypothetical protein